MIGRILVHLKVKANVDDQFFEDLLHDLTRLFQSNQSCCVLCVFVMNASCFLLISFLCFCFARRRRSYWQDGF